MSAVYFVRHGQAGPRDNYDSLSEMGARQAEALGKYFARAGLTFDAAYAGTLRRQRQTAEAAREACLSAGARFPEITEDARWDEFDLGDVYEKLAPSLVRDDAEFAAAYEGMLRAIRAGREDIHRNHNYCDIAVVRAWVDGRYPYKGESWEAFRARVLSPLEAINGHGSGKKILVFTSATPVSVWVGRALNLDVNNVWRMAGVTYNTSVTTLQVSDNEPRLFSFNALPHLPDASAWSFR